MTMPSEPLINAAFLKESLKRAPFVIVGKTVPSTLPEFDVNKDFHYFFYNDCIPHWTCLSARELKHKGRNAKTDATSDYEQVFETDVRVVAEYQFPDFLNIVEHWNRPGIQTIVHTRRTAVTFDSVKYILGCMAKFDDVELGVTAFRASCLPLEMPDARDVPLQWFEQAFEMLPMPMGIATEGGIFLKQNSLLRALEGDLDDLLLGCLARAASTLKMDKTKEVWEFSHKRLLHHRKRYRVWIWRPNVNKANVYVVCCRAHLGATVAGLPELEEKALG